MNIVKTSRYDRVFGEASWVEVEFTNGKIGRLRLEPDTSDLMDLRKALAVSSKTGAAFDETAFPGFVIE